MSDARGYSVLELLVAAAVLVTVLAAVTTVVHDGVAQTPALDEAGDLHQRARAAVGALARDLRSAGIRPGGGAPAPAIVAPLYPRAAGAPAAVARGDVLTARSMPANGAAAVLVQPLEPGVPAVAVEPGAGCPDGTVACGFTTGMRAVLFDEEGHADLVAVEGIAPGMLTIADVGGTRSATYPAGSRIIEAIEVTYLHDAVSRQLRRVEPVASFVVADNVVGLAFTYVDAALAEIPLSAFSDGPFRGTGPLAFDTDLLRVRGVRAALRVETAVDGLRGADRRLFARPGTSAGARVLPDLLLDVFVAPRNGGGS